MTVSAGTGAGSANQPAAGRAGGPQLVKQPVDARALHLGTDRVPPGLGTADLGRSS